MTISVICAGFQKTGTLSLKFALEELGLKCIHGNDVHLSHKGKSSFMPFLEAKLNQGEINTNQLKRWLEARGATAVCDFPLSLFYQELLDAYPNAKVILTVREPENWFESRAKMLQFERSCVDWIHSLLCLFDDDRSYFAPFVDTIEKLAYGVSLLNGPPIDSLELRDTYIDRYLEHNEKVKEVIPPERLLIFNVAEGWDPLCSFLKLEKPDKPFPRKNIGLNQLKRLVWEHRRKGLIRLFARCFIGFVAGLVFACKSKF